MYEGKTRAVLEFVLEMIDEINFVVNRHGTAKKALSDIEGKNAILLNFIQIGEKLNKIEEIKLRQMLHIDESYSIRNRITHDYGGIDLEIIEYIVDNELTKMSDDIKILLNSL